MATRDIEWKARAVLEHAIEIPEAERDAFVHRECAGDERLLDAVRRLWEGYQNKSFLDSRGNGSIDIPRQIGRFQILRMLGMGGMGVVYVARDPNLSREVAIKTFHLTPLIAGESSEACRVRLFQEAKSAGMLHHPNIVTIHDVEESAGTAFIVMELVQGSNLLDLLKARPLTWDEVLRILSQTAGALDFAHRKGVVHRDVKPANIMLDEGEEVKLTDFGIAKICERGAGEFTFKGYGTPLYMSPEQIENGEVTGQSDQFSLSVIAYQMLTGEVPFHGETEFRTMQAIASAPRPSAHRANPSLPPNIDQPLMRGMSISPQQRFSSCGEFVEALAQALQRSGAGRPAVKVAPDATRTIIRSRARAKQSRRVLSGGLLAAALAAAAAVLGYVHWRPQHAETSSSPKITSLSVQPPQGVAKAPRIVSFSTYPHTVAPGQSFSLRWKVRDAQAVSIDHNVGEVPNEGTRSLAADVSETYHLIAHSANGVQIGTATATITVHKESAPSNPPPNKDEASAAPPTGATNGPPSRMRIGSEDPQRVLEDGKAAYLGRGRDTDAVEAAHLFTRAADLGNSEGMVLLGAMYTQGEGVPRDYAHAVRLFLQAANAGNARGMDNLAHMYADGYGVTRSPDQAAFWYRKAADSGDADAAYHLGMLYEKGNGVPLDRDQALKLYGRAAALGKKEATLRIRALSTTANPQVALFSVEPAVIQAGQARQYKLAGTGLSLDSLVFVDGASAVGSRLGAGSNHRPVEASANGSWVRVYIYLDPNSQLQTSTITVQSGGSRASLVVPVRR